ncbi:molybdopterin-guanine dinucleotide biosynthesis protein MobB, partial [Staphylococcus lugdunensis]
MIIQIVGYKNSGKTTLMTHAVSFIKEKGFTVA